MSQEKKALLLDLTGKEFGKENFGWHRKCQGKRACCPLQRENQEKQGTLG